MRKLALVLLLIVPLALLCSGCAFTDGFTREMQKQMADDFGAAVETKLGDDFKGIGSAVSDGIKAIPQPPAAPSPLYDLGSAAAILAAFAARGFMRKQGWLGAGEVRIKKEKG
mgnify:CR=1 FL=1